MKRYSLLVYLGVALATLSLSPGLQAEEEKLLSQDLIWEIERIGSPVIAPENGHIIAPVTRYDMDEDESSTQLWLFSTDGTVQRPLSAEGQRVSNPVFSPDGTRLAFISRRHNDDANQIYLLPIDGPGEANRLTEVPTGVSAVKWVGEHLYFISNVLPGKDWDEMKEQIKKEDDSNVSAHQWNALPYASFDRWIDENREAHVFRIPADGGDVEAVTQPFNQQLPRSSQSASNYDVSPDETWIAFNSNSSDDEVSPQIDIFLARIGSDQAENLTEENRAPDTNPMFSPDGRTLAFTRQAITGFYADTADIMLLNLDSREVRRLTGDWDRSATGLVWTPDSSSFYGAIDDAGTVRVHHIDARSGETRPVTGETNVSNLSIADDGTLVGTNESFLYPARLVSIDPQNGHLTRLDSINDELLADVSFGTYESVTYSGHNGEEIQMWVHYPPGFDDSQQYPLFLLIHGGPHSAITNGFHYRWNAQTIASWGYVTAWHNFHGSSGFGQDFADAINPDWVTAPLADTLAAANWFEDKDWIDNDRLVAGGASYGGYLSTILLGEEHPFNALLIHAPVYNMYSQMASDFAVHSERFGYYWDDPDLYTQISPHYRAANFNTPALLIHGQLDYRVPVGQSFELFRTLQSRGVESRMIYFPDENHWILNPNNSVYWYNEVQRWMENFAEPGAR